MLPEVVNQICTHSGRFHADEALAIFMLCQLPECATSRIMRSREDSDWQASEIVVDVGAVYDPATLRFDHHQRGFQETFSPLFKTKLSSAGLVYKHFGKQLIQSIIEKEKHRFPNTPFPSDAELALLFDKVYKELIEEYDAHDNGISAYPSDIQPAFRVGATTVFARVNNLNPEWNAPEQSEAQVLAQFMKAVEITGETLLDMIIYLWASWLPARSVVVEAVENRFNVHPSGNVIYLRVNCPWKDHLYQIEEELNVRILYCMYPQQATTDPENTKTMIQAVPVTAHSFESRLALPESWRGLRDQTLDEYLSLEGCIFTHASGFIGGHHRYSGALAMVDKALQPSH